MSLKKILSFISLGIFLAAIIAIILSFKGGSGVGKSEVDDIIGKGLKYKVYNEFQELSTKITSTSSKRDFDKSRKPAQRERTLLTDIKGVIYKSKKFKNDIRFSGNSGYVENEYKNFLLKEDARIESEEITLSSDRFFMEGNSLISNKSRTDFKLKNLKGIARKGISYHMEIGVINLLKASGTYIKSGKEYHFKCNRLMVLNKFTRVVFKGNAHIQSDDSTMRGKEIILRFNKDFKKLNRTDIRGKGYFYTKGDKKGEFRELLGNKIIAEFDENENVKKIDVSKNGIVNLNGNGNRLKAESHLIYIRFDHISKKLKSVKLMRNGKINVTGKRSFNISSRRIRVLYNKEGEIENCNTHGKTEFTMSKYSGNCQQLNYYPSEDKMTLTGEKSVLIKGENRFVSPEFLINTKEEKLSSDKEILSTIQLESDNSIFSKLPVYVSSKKIEIDDKSGSVVYSTNVSLFQGDTKLNAERVEIGKNKSIIVSGKAILNFTNSEKGISISGEEIKIDPDKNFLYIKGKGVLGEGDNSLSGESLVVEFNDNKKISRVTGENKIEFKRKGVSGKSEKVIWMFNEKIITFITNAQLIKADSGSSKGDEIKFFIEDERVVIKSASGKRSETKID